MSLHDPRKSLNTLHRKGGIRDSEMAKTIGVSRQVVGTYSKGEEKCLTMSHALS